MPLPGSGRPFSFLLVLLLLFFFFFLAPPAAEEAPLGDFALALHV
jgi:hypothetical protein